MKKILDAKKKEPVEALQNKGNEINEKREDQESKKVIEEKDTTNVNELF